MLCCRRYALDATVAWVIGHQTHDEFPLVRRRFRFDGEAEQAPRSQQRHERLVVGVGRELADQLVQRDGIVAHQDPPAPGADTIEDDGRGLRRGGGRSVAEHLRLHLHADAKVVVARGAHVHATLSEPPAHVRHLLARQLLGFAAETFRS